MKHQNQRNWFRGIKRMLLTLLCLGAFAGTTQAQSVLSSLQWEDEAPRTVPTTLVALGDSGYVYINTKLFAKDAQNLKIEVALPIGIDFVRVGATSAPTNAKQALYTDANLTPAASFDNGTLTGTAAAGTRKFTINYTANSKTLRIGDSIVMKIAIKATCGVDIFNPGSFVIDLSATDFLLGGHREIQANVQKPTLRLYATPGYEIINYAAVKDTQLVSINIDAQNGYVTSFRAMFTYNPQIIYLDSFKIDGNLIPASRIVYNPVTVTTQTSRTVTITLTQAELQGRVTTAARALTFRATSNRGCNQFINSELWYDATYTNTNAKNQCANWWQGNQIILQLPSDGVAPAFTSLTYAQVIAGTVGTGSSALQRTIPYFDPNNPEAKPVADPHADNWNWFCWDGVTPNYGAIVFKNTNAAPTASFQFYTEMNHGSNLSRCEYIDTAQIYWRASVPSKIDGSDSIIVSLRKLPGSFVTDYANEYGTNTAIYDAALIGKDRGIYINLPLSNDNQLPPGVKIEVQWVVYANPAWIKDDYRARTTYKTYQRDYNNISYRWSSLTAGNACGQTFTWSPNSYNTVLYKPRFYVDAQQELTVYPEEAYTYSNYCTTHNYATETSDGMYTQVYVKLPNWLNLNMTAGTIESAFDIAGNKPTPGTGIYHGTQNGYRVYSVKYLYAYRNRTASSPFYYPNAATWAAYQADSMKNAITGLLNVKTIPVACLTTGIITDTMQVWFDYQGGNVQTGDCRGLFKKTSKLYSVVKFNCQPRALIIKDFGMYRQTRGYKDSDNDHYPDNGELAPDDEIQHWHYLVRDTGYYYIKGYVEGDASNVWDKLVAILKYKTGGPLMAAELYKWGTNNANSHTQPFWNDATIEIKRWNADTTAFTLDTFRLNIPVVNNLDSLTIYYDGVANDLIPRGGDSVFIKIPFTVIRGEYADRGSIDAATYGIKESNPTYLDGKHTSGDPIKVKYKGLDTHNRNGNTWTQTFQNACSLRTMGFYNDTDNRLYGLSAATYWHNSADNFNWEKEVRVLHKKMTFTIRIPAGYSRTKSAVDFNFMRYINGRIWTPVAPDNANPATTTHIEVKPISATEDFATHDSILIFDFSNVFDYDYQNYGNNGLTYNASTGFLSNGKLPIGDDGMGAQFIMPLLATPMCNSSNTMSGTNVNTTGACYYTFEDIYGGIWNRSPETTYLVYNGAKLYLETSPTTVYVNSQQLSLTAVKVQNIHGEITDNNTWLRVEGNVKNSYLIDNSVTPADTIWGVGLDNNWLEIGTLTPLQMKNYRLNFDYKGKDACGVNDTVAVYTVFDATNTNYIPDITKTIKDVNVCNRGTYQYTILDSESPRAKIAGSVRATIPNNANPAKVNYLHHNDPYYVTWQINGRVSQGALNNPSVDLRVPAGQIYVDTTAAYGVAQFEYPTGTWNPIPAAVLSQLQAAFGATSNDTQTRNLTIYAKDLVESDIFMLPGWGADASFGFTDSARVINIRIPFIPNCETDLAGLRFRGTFHGVKSCGEPVEDDGMVVDTRTIYTDVLPEYSFQVNLENLDMSNRLYTPDHNTDYFIATFHKDLGAAWLDGFGKAIKPYDYVRLRLPLDLTINGTITSPEFGVISITNWNNGKGDEDLIDGTRTYNLSFPIQQLNDSMATLMDSMSFTYRIPFLFTPDPLGGCSAPKKEIVCQVMTNVNFAPGICEDRPASVGSGELLLLTTSLSDASFTACINMPTRLIIACAGVTPVWYRDAVGTGGELGHNNYYDYTPTTITPDTFWIRGVYDYGGDEEEDFGVANVVVRKYPQVKPNFSALAVCEGTETNFIYKSGANASKVGTANVSSANT
ncbi:MAG: hypothetical protein LBN27_02740, partial [Prevotellaceae bacterium]|nr:hypothetical protein [Prevotellaceae bacterium]